MASDTIIDALIKALDSNPDDMDVRLHLAQLLLVAQRIDEASGHFETLLSKHPANLDVLNGALDVAKAQNKPEKAAQLQIVIDALQGHAQQDEGNASGNELDASNRSNVTQLKSAAQRKTHDSSDTREKLKVVETGHDDNVTVGPWQDVEAPITLADVGGMEEVKKRLNMAFLAPLKNPDIMKMYAKTLSGGMMLYGPPGCGKTFIARALAGELGAKFISIGLSDVLDMWLGESERKLHEIFEIARRSAPAVLFFDEIDALGQKRSQLKQSGGRNIVNQLLAEMDSVGKDNRNVFILAATNHPWDVDTALRRPGRFDRVVLVLPPDGDARKSILEYHLRERPVENLDLNTLAELTDNYSGADLAHLCNSAVEYAMQDSIESGQARPVLQHDFQQALREVKPSTRPWFETARNYALFANEGGMYDDLLDYIRHHSL